MSNQNAELDQEIAELLASLEKAEDIDTSTVESALGAKNW
jgi:hypothetical protein